MTLTRTHRTWIVAAAVAAIVTATNASQGGYFSQSWGWIALAFLMPTTVLLILERVTVPGRSRIAFATFVSGLGIWIAMSASWSLSSAASIREAERMLAYVALALAVALVLRRGDGPAVLAGATLGVVLICTYALGTRLLPDRIHAAAQPVESNRLAAPLGYWNSLGLLAAMGVLVALGFVAHARRDRLALAAAMAIPIGLTTLYFTFSRGGWLALTFGFVASVATDPRRVRLLWTSLCVIAPAVACIAYAASFDALTTEGAPRAAAQHDGHRVAVVLLLVVLASALCGWGARKVARHIDVSPRGRRGVALALLGAAIVVAAGALVMAGGPVAAADTLRERFDADPTSGAALNDRLFSASGNGRSALLRVAWHTGRDRPLIGNGSGTFEYLWYAERSTQLVVRDAHSLYMETFTELGLVGLILLLAALTVIGVAGLKGRRLRFTSAGFGAFSAWCAAAALDWHWEMVGVTMTALLAGAALLLSSERRGSSTLRPRARVPLIGICSLLSVFAVWSLVGNQALFAGQDAISRQDWSEARDDSHRARALLFWSAEPDIVAGDAAAGLGDRPGAVAAYRRAVSTDPRSWVAWLRLAQVSRGAERAEAIRRVRELNPLEQGVPGE